MCVSKFCHSFMHRNITLSPKVGMMYTLEYFTTLDTLVLYTLMLEQSLWEYFIAAGNTDQDGSALRV